VVLHPSWGEVEPDVVALNTGCAVLFGQSMFDVGDSLLFGAASEPLTDRTDVHVFEVAERSAIPKEIEVGVDKFIHDSCGKVVERETGDDEVERFFGLKLL